MGAAPSGGGIGVLSALRIAVPKGERLDVVALILIVIHIVAFVAGGANSVVMPILGKRIATASPEARPLLVAVADALVKIGKYSMLALLVTGLLVLWLRWNWVAPNQVAFWAKMAFVALMLVFISINERAGKSARAGDAAAAARSAQMGKLTSLAFLGVIASAVFAFH